MKTIGSSVLCGIFFPCPPFFMYVLGSSPVLSAFTALLSHIGVSAPFTTSIEFLTFCLFTWCFPRVSRTDAEQFCFGRRAPSEVLVHHSFEQLYFGIPRKKRKHNPALLVLIQHTPFFQVAPYHLFSKAHTVNIPSQSNSNTLELAQLTHIRSCTSKLYHCPE